jgi:hypothetical protein
LLAGPPFRPAGVGRVTDGRGSVVRLYEGMAAVLHELHSHPDWDATRECSRAEPRRVCLWC